MTNISHSAKLQEGQTVTILIPFTYTIGEEGPSTGNELKTIQDCMDEVRSEVEAGMDTANMLMTVGEVQ